MSERTPMTEFESRLARELRELVAGVDDPRPTLEIAEIAMAGGRGRAGDWSAAGLLDAIRHRGAAPRPGALSPAFVVVLLALALALAVAGALVAGARLPSLLSTGPRLIGQNAVNPTPVVTIRSGSHPVLTGQQVDRSVHAWITSHPATFHAGLRPPVVTAIAFDGLKTWAATVDGTTLSCASHCSGSARIVINVDDETGALALDPSAGSFGQFLGDMPNPRFLDQLAVEGMIFEPVPVPSSGIVSSGTVMATLATTAGAGIAPKGIGTYGPVFGTVECVDATKGCRAWGSGPFTGSVAIWWVGLPPNNVSDSPNWAVVDPVTGAVLAIVRPAPSAASGQSSTPSR